MQDPVEIPADEEEESIPQVTSQDIFSDVIAAAETHAALTDNFIKNFTFYGKPLSSWSKELSVKIPDQVTPEVMRALYVKLANSIQIASHFYSVSNTISSTLVAGGEVKKSDLVASLVKQYEQTTRRKPSGMVIERMADSYMSGTVSARIASKIVREFWRQHLDALVEVRKCLEQIGISLHVEMKHLNMSTDGT
jgi:hypothetical protein